MTYIYFDDKFISDHEREHLQMLVKEGIMTIQECNEMLANVKKESYRIMMEARKNGTYEMSDAEKIIREYIADRCARIMKRREELGTPDDEVIFMDDDEGDEWKTNNNQ
jgi:hypothetical protein